MQNITEKQVELTIITPTYNRAHTITACWESLTQQTNQNFQWLVIDDGSTDNTRQVINDLVSQKPKMNIDYIYKENGGKHTALNAAHPYIKAEYVLILDSDDTLTPVAVQEIVFAWKRFGVNKSVNVIFFYKCNKQRKLWAYVKHPNRVIKTYKERRYSHYHSRDCCDTYRTTAFQEHSFPVFHGERFIGEGSAFLDIELMGNGVFVNKGIYVCEYLEGGLTNAGRKMRLSNPLGGRYNSEKHMDCRLPFLIRAKNAILYVCYSFFAGYDCKKMVVTSIHKWLTRVSLIPGFFLYIYWKNKYF